MSNEQPRDPIETAIIDAPLLTQIALGIFEAGHPAGLHLAGQGCPRFIAHLGVPPQLGLPLQQRLEPTGGVGRSPALQLPFAIPQQGRGAPQTVDGAAFEQAQQLDPIGRPRSCLSFVSKAVEL
jgi:hypothetical protein